MDKRNGFRKTGSLINHGLTMVNRRTKVVGLFDYNIGGGTAQSVIINVEENQSNALFKHF